MKHLINIIKVLLLIAITQNAFAQEIMDDSVCVALDEMLMYNVSANDAEFLQGNEYNAVLLSQNNECFFIEGNGQLFFIGAGNAACCGTYELLYGYTDQNGNPFGDLVGTIYVTVKCPKPECGLVDLDEIDSDPAIGLKPTVYACEGSIATYFTSGNPSNTYTWLISGGTNLTVGNSTIIDIEWGSAGSGMITLIIDNGTSTETKTFCVEILDAPTADFSPLNDCACLNSPITFINNSIGGTSYYWDFGDGNNSNAYQPTHTFAAGGVYEVTLVVTKDNYDAQGNPLCCCSDSISMEIDIDPLEGPDIFWISTLCPGDDSKYWTDLTGCTLLWSVTEADSTIIPFTQPSPDSICVTWNDGPHGIVTLQAIGCSSVCDKPVSAIVPIVSSTEDIVGETVVCEYTTYSYDLPKWQTVTYDWTATGAINIAGNGGHSVNITWGPAGPGTIHVDYCSDFLGGLPGHDPEDCCGTADLNVNIKPEYSLIPPNTSIVCVGDTSTYSTSHPSTSFTWVVTPSATILGNGTYQVDIIWPSTGTYEVAVFPSGLNPFCNDTLYHYMNVVDIAQPDSITGPFEICPLDVKTYFAHSNEGGIGFEWDVIGGTPSNFTGNPITVTWDASGPYSLCVKQFQVSDPSCVSPAICQSITEKTIDIPLTLIGPPGCVNSVKTYQLGPPQTYDVTYDWMIIPPVMGSVITNQDSNIVDIQWNNVPGVALLTGSVTLCGVTESITVAIDVFPNPIPNITQIGNICPGGTASLDAGVSGFGMTYMWSPGGGATSTITITSPGVYTLTVTDGNGCSAIDTYEAFAVDGPSASISTPDDEVICNGSGDSATLHTLDNPAWKFNWYCNGVLQTQPAGQPFYIHNDNSTTGTYSYFVVVTDTVTGCTETSLNYLIYQDPCIPVGGGTGCDAQDYELTASNTNQMPYCNTVNFTTSTSANVTLTGWLYGDGTTGGPGSLIHTYNEAKYYKATVTGTVLTMDNSGTCPVSAITSVCIPLAADFEYSIECDEVKFTDASSFLDGHDISSWAWTFGTSGSGSGFCPTHTFTTSGSHLITLEVTDITGCKAIYTELINIYATPNPVINLSPSTVCVGDAVSFSVSGTGPIISYDWDFGDGSGNGGATPSHSYLTMGSKTITVSVTDENGCTGMASTTVMVHPNPIEAPISIAPDDIVCDGQSVTLTASGGVTYEWSDGFVGNPNTVGVSGTYDVTVTDVNGCFYVADPVDIIVLPPLDPVISGDTIICDPGCETLSAPTGFGYTYQWQDGFGGDIIGATNSTIDICSNALISPVRVVVTDANLCEHTSDYISITVQPVPSFGISVIGDLCAGSPNILSASPLLGGIDWYWSNGATGPTITANIAGVFTLFGRDTLTGCIGSAAIEINPIPDLCIVPTGCYDICNPDTICGPPGMESYQWNKDGVPILGETDTCLIVTESGSYSLTAENEFNCFNTSDTLILNVIPCCEDQTDIIATHLSTTGDTCCFNIEYENMLTGLKYLSFEVPGGVVQTPGIIDPNFSVSGNSGYNISFENSSIGSDLPLGNIPNMVELCIASNSWPKTVKISWLDEHDVVCMDSIILVCDPEPPCVYLLSDSIYCEDDHVYYEMTVCNPAQALYDLTYLDLQTFAPAGVLLSPSSIDLSANPLSPGDCTTITVEVLGSGLANQQMCFNIIGHENNPAQDPSALCCSLDTMYYVTIPGCGPCDSVYVSDISIGASGDSCCFDITIVNDLDDELFDGIDLCVLTPGSSIGVDVTGSIWTQESANLTYVELGLQSSSADPNPHLDYGVSHLPELCLTESSAYETLIEIKWMDRNEVVCRDTISLICESDCGNLEDIEILCNTDGSWNFTFSIHNTSGVTMQNAFIEFLDPGMNIYNTSIFLGTLPDGASFGPTTMNIGAPAVSGSTLLIRVTLHSEDHNDLHTDCCFFELAITLPDCMGEPPCLCDEDWEDQVDDGATIVSLVGSTATIVPSGNLSDCDRVIWDWIYQPLPTSNLTIGNQAVIHTFPSGKGEYKYCMTITRTQADGKTCEYKHNGQFEIYSAEAAKVNLYPNPVRYELKLDVASAINIDEQYQTQLFNLEGQLMIDKKYMHHEDHINSLDISDLKAGIYLVVIRHNQSIWREKVIVIR